MNTLFGALEALHSRRRFTFVLIVVAALLTAPALFTGRYVDDYLHAAYFTHPEIAHSLLESHASLFDFTDGNAEHTTALMDSGFFPWWTLPEVRLSLWRPLAELTHRIDYALWPDSALLMHVQSMAWYIALVLVVAGLYRKFLGAPRVAALAALLYAVDDAHSLPAGWLANRNAMVGALFAFLALHLHLTWREHRAPWALPAALIALAAGLLGNEGAVGITAFLFAYACFYEKGPALRRILTLAPYAVVVVAWRIVYSSLGHGTWGSPMYVDPGRTPLQFALAAAERWPTVLLAQWGIVPGFTDVVMPPGVRMAIVGLAVAVNALVFVTAWPLLKRDAAARFFALGLALSALPACATIPSDRLLMVAGFGGFGLIAMMLQAFAQGLYAHPFVPRAVCVAIVGIHLVLAPMLLPARIVGFATLGKFANDLALDTEAPEDIANRTVVYLDAPTFFFTSYVPVIRHYSGLPYTERAFCLGPNTLFKVPLTITRTDDRTLEVEGDIGFPMVLVRGPDHPFAVGDIVALSDRSVEVLDVSGKGVVTRVAYRFDRPLEDPKWLFYRFKDDRDGKLYAVFAETAPPRIGETVRYQ